MSDPHGAEQRSQEAVSAGEERQALDTFAGLGIWAPNARCVRSQLSEFQTEDANADAFWQGCSAVEWSARSWWQTNLGGVCMVCESQLKTPMTRGGRTSEFQISDSEAP
jgi:hypothetical protein